MNKYFDNATTSYPKPREVARSVVHYIEECGGSYGRGAYSRLLESSATVERCRDLMAQRLNATKAEHIFFTMNATQAANAIIKGLNPQKVLVSPLEHNATMRPLTAIGAEIKYLPSDHSGLIKVNEQDIDTTDIELIVVNHQSNVNGVIQPIGEIAEWAAKRGIALMVDTSQSLGELPVEVDYAIFTGHKGLFGPTGTGGFYAKNPDKVATFIHGGTGSRSDSLLMPEVYPDRFEAGTPNIVGLTGLLAALENPPKQQHTFGDFVAMIQEIDKQYTLHVSSDITKQGETFSVTHHSLKPSVLAQRLFTEFGIETRAGLHCAPTAHRHLGTFPDGTLRISLSPFHTIEDITYLIKALREICM